MTTDAASTADEPLVVFVHVPNQPIESAEPFTVTSHSDGGFDKLSEDVRKHYGLLRPMYLSTQDGTLVTRIEDVRDSDVLCTRTGKSAEYLASVRRKRLEARQRSEALRQRALQRALTAADRPARAPRHATSLDEVLAQSLQRQVAGMMSASGRFGAGGGDMGVAAAAAAAAGLDDMELPFGGMMIDGPMHLPLPPGVVAPIAAPSDDSGDDAVSGGAGYMSDSKSSSGGGGAPVTTTDDAALAAALQQSEDLEFARRMAAEDRVDRAPLPSPDVLRRSAHGGGAPRHYDSQAARARHTTPTASDTSGGGGGGGGGGRRRGGSSGGRSPRNSGRHSDRSRRGRARSPRSAGRGAPRGGRGRARGGPRHGGGGGTNTGAGSAWGAGAGAGAGAAAGAVSPRVRGAGRRAAPASGARVRALARNRDALRSALPAVNAAGPIPDAAFPTDHGSLLALGDRIGDAVPRGASQSEINRLPTEVYRASGSSPATTCGICLNQFKAGDRLRRLLCAHAYHRRCVDPWLRIKRICPSCRTQLPK